MIKKITALLLYYMIVMAIFTFKESRGNESTFEGVELKFGKKVYVLTETSGAIYIDYDDYTTVVALGDAESPIERIELSFVGHQVGGNRGELLSIQFKTPEERKYISAMKKVNGELLPDLEVKLSEYSEYVVGTFIGQVKNVEFKSQDIVKVSGMFRVKYYNNDTANQEENAK